MTEQKTRISGSGLDLGRTLRFVAFAAYAGLVLSLPFGLVRDYDQELQRSKTGAYRTMASKEEFGEYKILVARGMGMSFDRRSKVIQEF